MEFSVNLFYKDFKHSCISSKSGVYKILNNVNNKFYIGSATNLVKRKENHRNTLLKNKHVNILLQRALCKYGVSSFDFIILEFCDTEKLIEREQYYIDTLNPEYNICRIAGNTLGAKHSVETRKKMSESGKKKIFTALHKENISKSLKGSRHPYMKEYAKLGMYANHGEDHGMAILTLEIVIDIRDMKKNGFTRKEIHGKYSQYNCNTIDCVIYNSSWKHVK